MVGMFKILGFLNSAVIISSVIFCSASASSDAGSGVLIGIMIGLLFAAMMDMALFFLMLICTPDSYQGSNHRGSPW